MARTKGALNKTAPENKRSKVIHFRVTENERNEIHTFCALHNTTIIELIYMSYGRDFAELKDVKQITLQGSKRLI
jgi:hypothetical protein